MSEFREGWKPLLAAIVGTMCGVTTITNYSRGLRPVRRPVHRLGRRDGYDQPMLIPIGLLALSILLFLSLGKYPEEGRREMAGG